MNSVKHHLSMSLSAGDLFRLESCGPLDSCDGSLRRNTTVLRTLVELLVAHMAVDVRALAVLETFGEGEAPVLHLGDTGFP